MTGEPDREDDGAPATPRAGRGRHRAQRSRTRSVLLALLAVLVVVAGLAVGLGTLQVDTVAEDVDRVGDPFPDEQDRPEVAEAAEEARTFLVVGVDPADVATGATRAEAALLVRLTGDRRHAQVVTFPLDTWVAEQSTTLEGAFGADGPRGVVGAVETLTGVRVDHYAELDYSGFATVTDALGGISVDVPEEYGHQGRTFAPGPQQMDGAAALAYVRDASAATRPGTGAAAACGAGAVRAPRRAGRLVRSRPADRGARLGDGRAAGRRLPGRRGPRGDRVGVPRRGRAGVHPRPGRRRGGGAGAAGHPSRRGARSGTVGPPAGGRPRRPPGRVPLIAVGRDPGRRPLWLTVPLYAVLLVVVVLDVRAALFWSRVGGSLGTPVALAAGGIALLAVLLLGVDLRRQVLLGADPGDDDRGG